MVNFNEMYSKDEKAWRNNVSPILISALNHIKSGKALDLGCAQGKESLFLAGKGFNVVAVDLSSIAIRQLNEKIKKEKLNNIKTIKANVADFKIKKKNYDLIICFNVLYFLNRLEALRVLKNIKVGLKSGGIVVLSLFTVNDPFYNKKKNKRFYIKEGEGRKLFDKYRILDFFEGMINDSGHASLPEPHLHGVVKLVAQKI